MQHLHRFLRLYTQQFPTCPDVDHPRFACVIYYLCCVANKTRVGKEKVRLTTFPHHLTFSGSHFAIAENAECPVSLLKAPTAVVVP